MPISVTIPVRCVVRITDFESLVIIAFCNPIVKHSNITVSRMVSPRKTFPVNPKTISNPASATNGKAYRLSRLHARAQRISSVVRMLPPETRQKRQYRPPPVLHLQPRDRRPSSRQSPTYARCTDAPPEIHPHWQLQPQTPDIAPDGDCCSQTGGYPSNVVGKKEAYSIIAAPGNPAPAPLFFLDLLRVIMELQWLSLSVPASPVVKNSS